MPSWNLNFSGECTFENIRIYHQIVTKYTEWKPEHGKGAKSDGNTILDRKVEWTEKVSEKVTFEHMSEVKKLTLMAVGEQHRGNKCKGPYTGTGLTYLRSRKANMASGQWTRQNKWKWG